MNNTTETMNNTTETIKFGIRFGNQKRGAIITGKTVAEYLTETGFSSFSLCPTGGHGIKGGEAVAFSLTLY